MAGIVLNWTVIASHNFFHQRDNWRMYLFNLSMMSYRGWRISHALSHHIYPNTLHDLEISSFEPFLNWLPSDKIKATKGPAKYLPWLLSPILYSGIFYFELLKRIVVSIATKVNVFHIDEIVVPLIVPGVMLFFGNQSFFEVFKLWMTVLWAGGFAFSVIGINAAHHHPDILHEGDAHK